MRSADELLHGLKHPSLLFRELNRQLFDDRPMDGISVFEEDWDNLIILDACRYDIFAEENTLAGDLSKRTSRGSATKEWVKRNFAADLHNNLFDTVYVSANGWYEQLRDEMAPLHAEVWLYTEEYRNEMGTVDPEIVTDAAVEAAQEYPKKRLITHYVQPHKPYLGPTAERYFEHAEGINMVEMMSRSDGSITDLKKAYRETLNVALPEVRRLIEQLPGKTVVSADHGELLGERRPRMPLRNVGHPTSIRLPELREVPWLVGPYEERKFIVSEQPKWEENGFEQRNPQLEEHLEAMGYM